MRHIRFFVSALLALCALAAFAGSAQAAQGYLKGKLELYQAQGHFCAASRNCTGANYLERQFGTFMGVAEANLIVKDTAGSQIGTGTTDANGNFTVSWVAPLTTGAAIYVRLEHSTKRFAIHDFKTGTVIEPLAAKVASLTAGTTASFPQDVGTWRFGGPNNPHAHLNVYDGAWRTWTYALSESNLMWQLYTGIKIRTFSPVDSGTCRTSCADGAKRLVTIDQHGAYSPQARVMHEIGHVVSWLVNPHRPLMYLNYPLTLPTGPQPWFLTDPEHAADAWEEGFATFIGDSVMYEANAPTPFTCGLADGKACALGKFNVEHSPTVCEPGQERWPLTVTRLLRDYHDTVNEANDTRSTSFALMLEVWGSYPAGFGDHQIEEPYTTGHASVDGLDERAARDWQHNYDVFWGSNTVDMWKKLNCDAL